MLPRITTPLKMINQVFFIDKIVLLLILQQYPKEERIISNLLKLADQASRKQ